MGGKHHESQELLGDVTVQLRRIPSSSGFLRHHCEMRSLPQHRRDDRAAGSSGFRRLATGCVHKKGANAHQPSVRATGRRPTPCADHSGSTGSGPRPTLIARDRIGTLLQHLCEFVDGRGDHVHDHAAQGVIGIAVSDRPAKCPPLSSYVAGRQAETGTGHSTVRFSGRRCPNRRRPRRNLAGSSRGTRGYRRTRQPG